MAYIATATGTPAAIAAAITDRGWTMADPAEYDCDPEEGTIAIEIPDGDPVIAEIEDEGAWEGAGDGWTIYIEMP